MQRRKPFVWPDHDSSGSMQPEEDESDEDEDDDDDEAVEVENHEFSRTHALRALRSLRVSPPPLPPPRREASPPVQITVTGGGGRRGGRPIDDLARVPLNEHIDDLYTQFATKRYGAGGQPPVIRSEELDSSSLAFSRDEDDEDDEDVRPPPAHRNNRDELMAAMPPLPCDQRRLRRRQCFFCGYGDAAHDALNAREIAKIHNILNSQCGECDDEAIAQQVYEYYRGIWQPGMPRFTPEAVLEHIQYHTLAAKQFLARKIRTFEDISFGLEQLLFKGPPESRRHDKDTLTGLIQLNKQLVRLYTLKPESMNFNMGASSEDVARLGRPTNLVPTSQEQSERQARATKQQQRLDLKRARLDEYVAQQQQQTKKPRQEDAVAVTRDLEFSDEDYDL